MTHSIHTIPVSLMRLPHAEGLALPSYSTNGAAGIDFIAAVQSPLIIEANKRALIPTGLCIALPSNYELQIRPRSGLALKHGLIVPNSPGTIDEDYRGEICIIIMNTSNDSFIVERGMRIAQGVLAPVVRIEWKECHSLDKTIRGNEGFGSTGH